MRFFYFGESDSVMDSEDENEASMNAMLEHGCDEITEERFHQLRKELKLYWNDDCEELFDRFKKLGSGVEMEIESIRNLKGIVQNSMWVSADQIKQTKELIKFRKENMNKVVNNMFEDMDKLLIDIVTNLNKTNKEKLERIKEL